MAIAKIVPAVQARFHPKNHSLNRSMRLFRFNGPDVGMFGEVAPERSYGVFHAFVEFVGRSPVMMSPNTFLLFAIAFAIEFVIVHYGYTSLSDIFLDSKIDRKWDNPFET